MKRIVGIDPGLTGGVAVLNDGEVELVMPMPVQDNQVDPRLLTTLLGAFKEPIIVAIEHTQPMPKNGSIGSFKLGMATGVALGVVGALHLPLHRLRPAEWKKVMHLTGKSKDDSRSLASELWPSKAHEWRLKKHDGLAEAALIAEALRRTRL